MLRFSITKRVCFPKTAAGSAGLKETKNKIIGTESGTSVGKEKEDKGTKISDREIILKELRGIKGLKKGAKSWPRTAELIKRYNLQQFTSAGSVFSLYLQERIKQLEGPITERFKIASREFKERSEEELEKYKTVHKEKKEQRENEIIEFFKKNGMSGIVAYNRVFSRKAHLPKKFRRVGAYSVFIKEKFSKLDRSPTTDDFKVCGETWNNFSKEEKDRYAKTAEEHNAQVAKMVKEL